MALNVLLTILQQGLCYALVALGVYISYKILDFPDLTVDGTFPLGGVICINLIQLGCPFVIAILCAFLVGSLAGLVTGLFHVKCKISNLLSGILTMTGLLSITIALSKGRTLIPYDNVKDVTLFNNAFIKLFGTNMKVQALGKILILIIVVIACKLLLDLFLKTKTGFMLRAVGNNEQMCTSLGCDSGLYKILGLVIANGMVGLAGAIYGQYMNYFDNTSGTGMVVIALASVIIGCAMFKKVKVVKGTTAVIVGALIYTACLNFAVACGIPTTYLKLLMALLFAVILILNNTVLSKDKMSKKKGENKNA